MEKEFRAWSPQDKKMTNCEDDGTAYRAYKGKGSGVWQTVGLGLIFQKHKTSKN